MDPFPAPKADTPTNIPLALRGRMQLAELTTFSGQQVYLVTLGGGGTRIVPLAGPPQVESDRQRIVDRYMIAFEE